MTVALWFMPQTNTPVYETIHSLILSLQTLFPDAAYFEPHLTITAQLKCETQDQVNQVLTSCVAAVQAVRSAVRSSKEPLVTFRGVSVGKPYFTKVRLVCEHNKYLMGIAQIMRELYVADGPEQASQWLQETFRPHVSLVYSDMYYVNQALERVVVQRIEDALDLQMHSNAAMDDQDQSAWLFDRPLTGWGLPGTFKVVRCEGPVDEWEVLGSVEV
ncbi:LAFE_0H01178g1_1 [Lachancea fermentati]|uniref:2',3'-cyclic-nucleotide 3'-phosphodiesterase n=1 Tax=Lachancea fermentati TaxID=4955 RepID=A0A1G4MJB5_LACFM|nr:LAFE_0H01178g1_1 [Lachancea fermentati]